jgi:hypothetical protein
MAKKSRKPSQTSNTPRPPKKTVSPEIRAQREALASITEELEQLHEISMMVMSDKGILPPLYAGDHLGEDREVIPLWGVADDKPDLGALLLRVLPGVEPNPDLEMMRDELGLTNDWPISELLEMLVLPDGEPMVEGADEIKKLSMLFALFGTQVHPAPGYDRETMLAHIADMQPYAVFPIIPVTGEGEDLTYNWEDLENFRAEVVYAESPQLLEAAVWEYRINHALQDEIKDLEGDGVDPDEELMAQDTAGLSALFEMLVMRSLRLYGTTSPVRARQLELDILREENGDLVVKSPLKPEVEPISLIAEDRVNIRGRNDDTILHLPNDSPAMQHVWPQVRSKKVFCLRVRFGIYSPTDGNYLHVGGFSENPTLEWFMAESLPELYAQVRLAGIYEMLAATDLLEGKIQNIERL